jgi:hemerythrin superfamily protein
MDIYHYLKKDHREVAAMMDKVVEATSHKQRLQLFEQIKLELTLHAETEEATFYSAVEHATRSKHVQEEMEHAHGEHDEIREYLKKLSAPTLQGDAWIEMFGEFKHSVSHHVEEEESDMFEKAKQYLTRDQEQTLAKEMDAMKKQMMQKSKAA